MTERTLEDDVMWRQVRELMQREDWIEVLHLLEANLTEVDRHPSLSWDRAWAAFKLENCADAVSSFRRACALEPTNRINHWGLGLALEKVGNIPEAELSFLRSIALKDSAPARLALANLYLNEGKDAEAEQVQREGVRLSPTYRERIEALADLLSDLGKSEEAAHLYQAAEMLPTRSQRRAKGSEPGSGEEA